MSSRAGPTSYVPRSSDSGGEIVINHSESPLANLVRRTSSRRIRQNTGERGLPQHNPSTPRIEETEDEEQDAYSAYNYNHSSQAPEQLDEEPQYAYAYQPQPTFSDSHSHSPQTNHASNPNHAYATANTREPPRRQVANLRLDIQPQTSLTSTALHSPLLHSHFARYSTATASSLEGSSYYDHDASETHSSTGSHQYLNLDSSASFRNPYDEYDGFDGDRDRYFGDDASSMYSNATSRGEGPALRDSWTSTATDATMRRPDHYDNARQDEGERHRAYSENVPSVVVSAPDIVVVEPESQPSAPRGGGRVPVVKPVVANFSRPIRESAHPEYAVAMGESVTPQLPPDMREQKMKVLERNAKRAPSPNESWKTGAGDSSKRSPMVVSESTSTGGRGSYSSRPSLESVDWQASTMSGRGSDNSRGGGNLQQHPRPPPMSLSNGSLHPQSSSGRGSNSPVSVYSDYSYYQYEGPIPSPTGSNYGNTSGYEEGTYPARPPSTQQERSDNARQSLAKPPGESSGGRTPEDFLQLGIQHHEANRLQESARCFERSANERGGCGVGMLMYGLTLRHGWGCRKNEKAGFKWLMKAAESAVGDLERVRTSGGQADVGVVQVCVAFGFGRRIEVDFEQTELVLAIYEVGQCFFHGWGVVKDQKMAVVSFDYTETKIQSNEDFCRAITWLQPNSGMETRRAILRTALRMEKGARKTRRRRRDGIEQRCRKDKVMLDSLGFSRTSTCSRNIMSLHIPCFHATTFPHKPVLPPTAIG